MSTLVRELTIDDFSDEDIELAFEELIQRDYFNDILREPHKQKEGGQEQVQKRKYQVFGKVPGVN